MVCLRLLIGAHANLEATDSAQQTPLHWAAGIGHLPAIRCMVAAGASMAVRDKGGLTPRRRAIKQRKPAAAQLLLELEQQQTEASGTATASTAAAQAAPEAAAAGSASTAEASAAGAAVSGCARQRATTRQAVCFSAAGKLRALK